MENISYVENVDQFPIKMRRVVVGCDFAVSGDVGSDYTVYTVWGVDNNGVYYLMHIWRKKRCILLRTDKSNCFFKSKV